MIDRMKLINHIHLLEKCPCDICKKEAQKYKDMLIKPEPVDKLEKDIK